MENTNQTERFLTTDVGATIDRATYEKLETYCNKNFIKRGLEKYTLGINA